VLAPCRRRLALVPAHNGPFHVQVALARRLSLDQEGRQRRGLARNWPPRSQRRCCNRRGAALLALRCVSEPAADCLWDARPPRSHSARPIEPVARLSVGRASHAKLLVTTTVSPASWSRAAARAKGHSLAATSARLCGQLDAPQRVALESAWSDRRSAGGRRIVRRPQSVVGGRPASAQPPARSIIAEEKRVAICARDSHHLSLGHAAPETVWRPHGRRRKRPSSERRTVLRTSPALVPSRPDCAACVARQQWTQQWTGPRGKDNVAPLVGSVKGSGRVCLASSGGG